MSFDEAVDRLYGVDPDEFVAERSRLVKEVRGAGDRETADAVAKLRKPNVAAWALNRLARDSRRDVDLLLDAGHRLRQAQAGVLRGAEREEFERARNTEADALRRLLRRAEELLRSERGGASASVLGQVEESLRAAAVSEEGRELLARGRFSEPVKAGGFDLLAGLAPETPVRRPPREDKRARQAALREARARLREAEQAERAAEKERERAEAELAAARAAREAAEQAVEEAQRQAG
jgi:hypothetical protein